MYSIVETIENGTVLVSACASIRIEDKVLYWPPAGSSIKRNDLSPPGSDWTPHMCKILKENIGKNSNLFALQYT